MFVMCVLLLLACFGDLRGLVAAWWVRGCLLAGVDCCWLLVCWWRGCGACLFITCCRLAGCLVVALPACC